MGAGTGLALCDRHLPLRVGSSRFLGDAARGTLAFPREVGSGPSSTARTDQLPCSSVDDRVLLDNEIITFFCRLVPRWVVLGCGWRRWREGPEPREAAEAPIGPLVPSERQRLWLDAAAVPWPQQTGTLVPAGHTPRARLWVGIQGQVNHHLLMRQKGRGTRHTYSFDKQVLSTFGVHQHWYPELVSVAWVLGLTSSCDLGP